MEHLYAAQSTAQTPARSSPRSDDQASTLTARAMTRPEDREGDQRLDEHRELCPARDRHGIGRAECQRVGERRGTGSRRTEGSSPRARVRGSSAAGTRNRRRCARGAHEQPRHHRRAPSREGRRRCCLPIQMIVPASSSSLAEFVSEPPRDEDVDQLDRRRKRAQQQDRDKADRDHPQRSRPAVDRSGVSSDQRDEQYALDAGEYPRGQESLLSRDHDGQDYRPP